MAKIGEPKGWMAKPRSCCESISDEQHEAGCVNYELPPVLDACCGTRAFWFDRKDPRALFIDKRREIHPIDKGTPGTVGRNPLVIDPDQIVDFTDMPFPDETFQLVVFDPPHIERKEARGAITKRYGVLSGDWRSMLRAGFSECFRVLKPGGVLVFKWGESSRKISEILELTSEEPLFGHQTGKLTHWCVFMKESA